VVAQCGDGIKAFDLIERLKPDVAVLDLSLTGLFAMELVRKVRLQDLDTRIIILSVRRDRKTVVDALRGGASGFVLKSGPARHLIDAIAQVMEGGVYVSPTLELNQVLATSRRKEPADPIESLSAREYQVFSLLVDGVRAKEIAGRLELSPKTIDTYRASLMRKLDIHDVAGLVKFALQREII
jgi:DNA-binding NarL/FixJ family response regulator